MKTKKLSKKLVLNKKTIADLNIKKMNDVLGGVPATKNGNTCVGDTCVGDTCVGATCPWTCPYQICFPYKTETTCVQCCP